MARPRILHVVGARPNFMKIAPILKALEDSGMTENVLLHTGQHYDAAMSDSFFQDLGIRRPDVNLGVGSGPHGAQTAEVLKGTEEVLSAARWDYVVVVGDVNSTLAAALAAAKLHIPVAHVEAGLRSRDRRMPEELNRILTDQIADLCLTPSRDADENLRAEGIGDDRVEFVGNVMIDSLEATLAGIEGDPIPVEGAEEGAYVLVTLHRPSNVDDLAQLRQIVEALSEIATRIPVYFPVHPRTQKAIVDGGLDLVGVTELPPLPYRSMLRMQASAGLVLTDSGGIQEETTVLGIPCLTLRASTERPVTVTAGTNRLVPERTTEAILAAFHETWGSPCEARRPEGWDGRAALRIRDALHQRVI